MFPFLPLRSMVGSTGEYNGYQEEKMKEPGPPQFVCWTLHKPRNRATPEWLVSEDGPAQRHLDKNEAISVAHQLWLTPNRACTRSKARFALRSFVVWTKVVNKPITMEPQQIFFCSPLVLCRLLYRFHCPRLSVHNDESHQSVAYMCVSTYLQTDWSWSRV